MRKWEDLPEFMKCDEVKEYYNILSRKKVSLILKRGFDLVAGVGVLVVTAIPMLVIGIKIATESEGGVFYRQERVTIYGKKFKIHKFRTMVAKLAVRLLFLVIIVLHRQELFFENIV